MSQNRELSDLGQKIDVTSNTITVNAIFTVGNVTINATSVSVDGAAIYGTGYGSFSGFLIG